MEAPPGLGLSAVGESQDGWLAAESETPSGEVRPVLAPGALGVGEYEGRLRAWSEDPVIRRDLAVTLTVDSPPPGAIAAVVNAASFEDRPIAPGEIVSIFGTGFGPATGASPEVENGRLQLNVAGWSSVWRTSAPRCCSPAAVRSTLSCPMRSPGAGSSTFASGRHADRARASAPRLSPQPRLCSPRTAQGRAPSQRSTRTAASIPHSIPRGEARRSCCLRRRGRNNSAGRDGGARSGPIAGGSGGSPERRRSCGRSLVRRPGPGFRRPAAGQPARARGGGVGDGGD